jgi:predicted secreted protein
LNRKLFLCGVVLSVLLYFSLVPSVGATSMWTRTYGGSGNDCPYSLVAAADGGYALAGSTEFLGAGGEDFWLVKTDSLGNMQWNRRYGGIGNDVAYSLIATSDGGYVLAGSTESFGAGGNDFWLVKIDALGNMQWNKTYGGASDDGACSLVAATEGGYTLAGHTFSVGAGGSDILVGEDRCTWKRSMEQSSRRDGMGRISFVDCHI